ncbi:hypothetical protein [Pseudovibrio sp. Tun.PSC04-5.I4]|uniref:tetratricopeptide repeat protein n=1 Tax=Pseudovibrio sp. Tun.PSC04-5.I4 TaxID=1798213 RepID=UPI00088D9B2E|nr:hypothetical protein [Pseudovibrio sp. Tun.PSC04-5.I4]SDR32200.1 hypothetical protein SAMN04515695_4474 [Pseudovibrio sp. Tun.PSC04-5.I4]
MRFFSFALLHLPVMGDIVARLFRFPLTYAVMAFALTLVMGASMPAQASEQSVSVSKGAGVQLVRGLPNGHPPLSTGPSAALQGPAGGPAQIGRAKPGLSLPSHYTRQQLLDALFLELRDADNSDQAQAISSRIHSLFMQSGSHTLSLLMLRSGKAIESKEYGLALDLLDAVVRLDPGYVEGWNRRATVHFLREDLGRSLADIERVLLIEPRHYPALSGFGMILRKTGKNQKALAVFKHVLSIYPLLPNAQEAVKNLHEQLWGQYH